MRRLLALLATAVPLTAAAQWTFDAEGARVYDDNLSRAQRESDIARDRAWTARAAIGRLFSIGDGDAAVRAEFRGARYDHYSGLDHHALGVGAGWRRKLGLGLTAPWLAFDASVLAEDYETQVRDGHRADASVTLGKRFDERVEVSLRAAYDRRSQSDDLAVVPGISGQPFSLQGRSLSLKGSYAFSDRGLVFLSAGMRHGDVVSSTRRNLEIFSESAAIASDAAFGPDFIAYRLTGARTRTWSVGLSWTLGRRVALEAALARDQTAARGGLDYDGNIYSFSLVYSD